MMMVLQRRLWLLVPAILALAIAGCATQSAPGRDVRQFLAPTGKLRVGVYPGSPTSLVRDPTTREPKGVTWDIGQELARRLGVPFEAVEFPRVSDVVEAIRAGKVDFTVTNATPARAKNVDFTAPLLHIELGYLVLVGSPVTSIEDADRPGINVGVTQGSTSQVTLSRELKNATLVPSPTVISAIEMLSQRKVDAYATNKTILFEMSNSLPGSRVLEGRWGIEHMGIGIPKGRDAGMAWLRQFAEDAMRDGLVRRAAERSGLRGAVEEQ